MAHKKSLGSNPLAARKRDPVLREMLKGPAGSAEPKADTGPRSAAVVLSGRGAEAAFEAGVLTGLTSQGGFDAEIFTGVSVGALNAAVLAGHDGDLASATTRLRGIWLDELASDGWTGRNGLYRSRGDPRAFFSPGRLQGALADLVGDGSHLVRDALRRGARVVRSGDDLGPRMLWLADLSSMLSLDPFEALVARVVDLEALRGSRRRLRVATADWVTGAVDIRDGSGLDGATGHRRIVASAARPGIFPCVEIEGVPCVEAGAFAGSDLNPALEAGAAELHVPVFLPTRKPGDRPASTIDAMDRLLSQMHHARLERELAELRARRSPGLSVHLYQGGLGAERSHGFLDLRRGRVSALIEHGREVALRHDCRSAGCLLGES